MECLNRTAEIGLCYNTWGRRTFGFNNNYII